MQSRFQGLINKSFVDEHGNRLVQVKHGERIVKVFIARSDADLDDALRLDNRYFTGPQEITFDELKTLRQFGDVMLVRHEVTGEVLGVTQILYRSIPTQEVRMHEAFSYGTAGRGVGQILYKAQEVLAREAGKHRIRCTVRVENTETIRAQFKAGYRIVAYDPTRYGPLETGGGRLIMEKDLINETYPFLPTQLAEQVRAGAVQQVDSLEQLATLLDERPDQLGVHVYNRDENVIETHRVIQAIMEANYVGIGVLQAGEVEYRVVDQTRKLLVFQRIDLPPRADRLAFPIHVHNEYDRLREVIVSYTPENAQIKAKYAINDVARRNVNNIDPIAFKDEYNLFVGTLVANDVRVVHTNALGADGKSAIFTRDPAYAVGDTLVIGRLAQKQRHYESDAIRQISAASRMLELDDEPDAVTEGGDIIFIGERRLAVGVGQRTTMAGVEKLRKTFPDYSFIAVPHDDLHLDVRFTMLGPKKCLADVTRLPDDFLDLLREDGFTIVEADPEEQVSLGCNVVCIAADRVIAARENRVTNQRLREHGVDVVEVSMPNIVKWGGGPRCMTCPIHRGG